MRSTLTFFFVFSAFGMFAQVRTGDQQTNARVATNSSQAKEGTALPYNMEDPYMGRKAEFLGNMIVTELPADFPVYDKKWTLREYNKIVDKYYSTHLDLLREGVKQKILAMYPPSQK